MVNDELLGQREFLLRSIGDLARERDAGELSMDDWKGLHDEYAERLEEVQAAIDGRAMLTKPQPRGRKLVALLIALSVILAAVGAGVFVAGSAGSRDPGATVSGDIRSSSASKLAEAAAFVRQGKPTDALRLYDEVIADDPESGEAHAERGLLLLDLARAAARPALATEGRRSIEEAIRIDPRDPRPRFYLAIALRLQDQVDAAKAAAEQALALDPPELLRQQIEQFRAALDQPG